MKSFALCVSLLSVLLPAGLGQGPAPATASAMLPNVPAGIFYRYWPRQFHQWIGPELPYSMIELSIDDRGAKPLYDVSLIDRATDKRVHYTNEAAEAALDQAAGAEAHVVAMQFDAPAEAVKGATYLMRFVTETGTPVAWQFVQGSDITEEGSGMTPIDRPAPILLYREQGAVAGEGSAVRVGKVTSTAEMWKEISQPPYFIAYRGAISQDVHEIVFVPMAAKWQVAPATAAVAAGADWTLTSGAGTVLAAHVDSIANGAATLHETNAAMGLTFTLDAQQTPTGWALARVRYAPTGAKAEHAVSFTFAPPLGDAGPSKFEITLGKKTKLASGTVTVSGSGSKSWVVTQPGWAHKEAVVASATETR